jgi:hypothetical protein
MNRAAVSIDVVEYGIDGAMPSKHPFSFDPASRDDKTSPRTNKFLAEKMNDEIPR